jgi:hypothetical protein
MNLAICRLFRKRLFPFPLLDGPPQMLEGTPERSKRGE